MSSCLQAKVLEFWSPAPLPGEDAGKDAAAPANLKEPEADDLEASSDSSIEGNSDVDVVGAPASTPKQQRHAVRKISASKAGMRGALPKGAPAAASRSGSEEPGAEDAPELSVEGANTSAGRAEGEAVAGLTCIGEIGSPLLVPRPLPPAAPLKLSFTARHSGG